MPTVRCAMDSHMAVHSLLENSTAIVPQDDALVG